MVQIKWCASIQAYIYDAGMAFNAVHTAVLMQEGKFLMFDYNYLQVFLAKVSYNLHVLACDQNTLIKQSLLEQPPEILSI